MAAKAHWGTRGFGCNCRRNTVGWNARIAIANTCMSITQNKVRAVAGLLAAAVWVTLVARLWLTATEDNLSYLAAAWHDLRYFTIWTNTLIGAVCTALALGWRVPQWMCAGMALSIALVAGVYHALLAAGRNLVGLDWAIDLMLHTVIPSGAVIRFCILPMLSGGASLTGFIHISSWMWARWGLWALARGLRVWLRCFWLSALS